MKGVYIIKFEIYPGIYKVGCSKNISKRVQQFKSDSLILGNVELLYRKKFINYKKAEKEIHEKLKQYRVQENREFFKIDWRRIKSIIDSISDNYFENNQPYQNKTDLIFNWLLTNCYRKDLNEITLTCAKRKTLCKKLSVSNSQITNSLNKLKKSRKISGSKGSFIVNFKMF
jgi:hypothetical protein